MKPTNLTFYALAMSLLLCSANLEAGSKNCRQITGSIVDVTTDESVRGNRRDLGKYIEVKVRGVKKTVELFAMSRLINQMVEAAQGHRDVSFIMDLNADRDSRSGDKEISMVTYISPTYTGGPINKIPLIQSSKVVPQHPETMRFTEFKNLKVLSISAYPYGRNIGQVTANLLTTKGERIEATTDDSSVLSKLFLAAKENELVSANLLSKQIDREHTSNPTNLDPLEIYQLSRKR
jgi:hypothetical protein